MKKLVFVAVCLLTGSTLAQSTTNNIYPDSIQIKNDSGQIMALVNPKGETTLIKGYTYDNVINSILTTLIKQNAQYQIQAETSTKVIEDAKNKATITAQKASEILQLWLPPTQNQPYTKTMTTTLGTTTTTISPNSL